MNNLLSPECPNNSETVRNLIWQFILEHLKNKDLLPFLAIIAYQSQDMIKSLLQGVENVNFVRDRQQFSLLHAACMTGNAEIAELLITRGADVNAAGINGETPLHFVAQTGCLDLAIFLLKKSEIDVNARDVNGATPLLETSRSGCLEMARLLLNNKANVSEEDNNGNSPLSEASCNGNLKMVTLLLDYKPEPAYQAFTAYHCNEGGTQANTIKKLLLKYYMNKVFFEDDSPEVEAQIMADTYSEITTLLEKDPKLLLLCAIFTHQPLKEIERILMTDAYIDSLEAYDVSPTELADKCYSDAVDFINELQQKAVEKWDPEPDIEAETAGYDSLNKNKRPFGGRP